MVYDFYINGDFPWYIIPSIDHDSKKFCINMYRYEDVSNPTYYYKSLHKSDTAIKEMGMADSNMYAYNPIHDVVSSMNSNKILTAPSKSENFIDDLYVYNTLLEIFNV